MHQICTKYYSDKVNSFPDRLFNIIKFMSHMLSLILISTQPLMIIGCNPDNMKTAIIAIKLFSQT